MRLSEISSRSFTRRILSLSRSAQQQRNRARIACTASNVRLANLHCFPVNFPLWRQKWIASCSLILVRPLCRAIPYGSVQSAVDGLPTAISLTRADDATSSITSAVSHHRFVLCSMMSSQRFGGLGQSGFCQRKRALLFKCASPSRRSRPGQGGWMVMSFSLAGSSIRAFAKFRRSRRAITFTAFGLLSGATLMQSSRPGSRKRIALASNATSNERSNQPMKPTQSLVLHPQNRRFCFTWLGGLSISR